MPSVTKSVNLGLSQEDAFRLTTDPTRFDEWLTLHGGWPQGAPTCTEPGQQFIQKLVILGMPADVSWTVDENDAASRFVMTGAGPMGANLATTITVTAEGEISYEAEFSGGGIRGPMGDMVTKKAGEELETSLGKLKTLAG